MTEKYGVSSRSSGVSSYRPSTFWAKKRGNLQVVLGFLVAVSLSCPASMEHGRLPLRGWHPWRHLRRAGKTSIIDLTEEKEEHSQSMLACFYPDVDGSEVTVSRFIIRAEAGR